MLRLSASEAAKLGLSVKEPRPRRARRPKVVMSPHMLPILCLRAGLPKPIAEYRFCDGRKWAFDWAWPDRMVALECEGGIWTGGRHTRGKGFKADIRKYNLAATMGWRLVRCTPEEIKSGTVLETLKEVLCTAPPKPPAHSEAP